jgi:hypothetical protein
MKNHLTLICSFIIIINTAVHPNDGYIKGFILGAGLGGSFSMDQTTTAFLNYNGNGNWVPGIGLLP